MNVALIFAADDDEAKQLFAPYHSRGFIEALRRQQLEPAIIHLIGARDKFPTVEWTNRSAEVKSNLRAPSTMSLSDFLRCTQPPIVYTFGNLARLASVWAHAAQFGCLVAHFVTGESRAIRRTVWSREGLCARHASRHVNGIVGPSRSSIRDYIEAGFFPKAKFTMITLPPAEIAAGPAHATQSRHFSTPALGYYEYDGADDRLKFLMDAINLTGSRHLFRFVIARKGVRPAMYSQQHANVFFHPLNKVEDFVQSIDVLIFPHNDDRAMEAVLLALRSNKIIIVPDGGTISEALQFGRHGVLFREGSAYDLSMAINNVSQSWHRPPFDFKGIEAVIAPTNPDEVARILSRAYRRLNEQVTPELRNRVAR